MSMGGLGIDADTWDFLHENISSASASFIGEDADDGSGTPVASAGDVNGDDGAGEYLLPLANTLPLEKAP